MSVINCMMNGLLCFLCCLPCICDLWTDTRIFLHSFYLPGLVSIYKKSFNNLQWLICICFDEGFIFSNFSINLIEFVLKDNVMKAWHKTCYRIYCEYCEDLFCFVFVV